MTSFKTNPVRTSLIACAMFVLVAACDDNTSKEPDAGTDAGADASSITDLVYGEFEPWGYPIQDYIDVHTVEFGEDGFFKSIFDLAVFEDRLYLGYGDADRNLGRITPIEIRFWTQEDPLAVSAEFTTDEEQIDRFRQTDDLLMIPGVDATEDDLLGNAYTLGTGGEWHKSRTLELAWHVHDMAVLDNIIYACGSGGTMDDYNNSTVNALFYESDDGGENFTLAQQITHPDPPGDQRLTTLLSVGGELYAFGYVSKFEGSSSNISSLLAYRKDGDELVPLSSFPSFWVTDAVQMTEDLGIIVGVHTGGSLAWGCILIDGTDSFANVPMCEGKTVLDLEPLADGRTLVIYLDMDTYPTPDTDSWGLRVGVTEDGSDLVDLISQDIESSPQSIAYWRKSLYLGLDNGEVWRSEGLSP